MTEKEYTTEDKIEILKNVLFGNHTWEQVNAKIYDEFCDDFKRKLNK